MKRPRLTLPSSERNMSSVLQFRRNCDLMASVSEHVPVTWGRVYR